MVHLDVKKLVASLTVVANADEASRRQGVENVPASVAEFVHVAVDDYSRYAYAEILI
jgi:hypothetical protein